MALNNIFNEPRREITEQAIGFGVFIVLLPLDYFAAVYLASLTMKAPDAGDTVFLMFMLPPVTFAVCLLLYGLSFVIHSIGEAICNRLEDVGLDPRPKVRGRIRW